MFFPQFKRFQSIIIFFILVCFMIVSLWVRSLSSLSMDLPHYLTFSSPDIWYNFRQIELMIHNFPVYSWFDPMTAYPTGKSIDWGPFLPLIAASLSILTGMTSRADMMYPLFMDHPGFRSIDGPGHLFYRKIPVGLENRDYCFRFIIRDIRDLFCYINVRLCRSSHPGSVIWNFILPDVYCDAEILQESFQGI